MSGVSGLFTREFYAQVRRNLAADGVFAQWLHLYEMNDDLVRSVLAALQTSFPVYDVYMVGESDIAVIATVGDDLSSPDWSVVDFPLVREDLARVAPLTPTILGGLHVASSEVLGPFVGTAKPNSDFEPLLDVRAERARFIATSAVGFRTLNSISFDFASALSRRPLALPQAVQPAVDVSRINIRATSARLRAGFHRDSVVRDTTLYAAIQRRNGHDAMVRSGRPSPNWQLWTQRLAIIDRDIHGGSAGAVDTVLYNPLEPYLRQTNAPPVVRSAVEFMRAMNSWDFVSASRAADVLFAHQMRGENWIPADYLRDGAVTAKLMIGDPTGALRVFSSVNRFTRTDAIGRFRSGLLLSHIARGFSGRQAGSRLAPTPPYRQPR